MFIVNVAYFSRRPKMDTNLQLYSQNPIYLVELSALEILSKSYRESEMLMFFLRSR